MASNWIIFLCLLSQCVTGDKSGQKEPELGERCDKTMKCGGLNVICNRTSHMCQCDPKFPLFVQTSRQWFCLKHAKLGEECLHDVACLQENSGCQQVSQMNAVCACKAEHYEIFDKNSNTNRCVPEIQLLNSDLATLIGVGVGMTLFCGLTCLVLRIFARARFGPRHLRYGNAHLAPPITLALSSEHGGEGSGSRKSSQRSSIGGGSRRPSGSLLAPPKRSDGTGSRRASNSSIRSTSSARSQRSYSLRTPNQNHHHHLQHRPSDPEGHHQQAQALNLNLGLTPDKLSVSSNLLSASPSPSNRSSNQPSPQKDKRSSSTGAI